MRGIGGIPVTGLIRSGVHLDNALDVRIAAVWGRRCAAADERSGRAPALAEARLLAVLEAAVSAISRSHADESRAGGETDGGSYRVLSGECTVKEAAVMLGRGERTVQLLLAASAIEGRKTDRGRWVTTYEAVRAYQEQDGGAAA